MIQEFVILLGKEMEQKGFGDFWKTSYTDAERLDLAERILTLSVVMVKTHKKIQESKK